MRAKPGDAAGFYDDQTPTRALFELLLKAALVTRLLTILL